MDYRLFQTVRHCRSLEEHKPNIFLRFNLLCQLSTTKEVGNPSCFLNISQSFNALFAQSLYPQIQYASIQKDPVA